MIKLSINGDNNRFFKGIPKNPGLEKADAKFAIPSRLKTTLAASKEKNNIMGE